MENYVKIETISLKNHKEINEKWVQQKIEEDPSILGLGELTLRQSEKIQQLGGRVDMLLQDMNDTRYAVELQLGKTDETHIIRTIEYWDNERKRNKSYKYVAVIIAEDITNRFFNVISLFNNSIPIIAIQLKAIKYNNDIGLHFTKILDVFTPDDEEEMGEPTDRAYWEKNATKETIKMADKFISYVSEFVHGFELKYNKHYIGVSQNGIAKNFIHFNPRKSWLQLNIKLDRTDEVDEIIENSELEQMQYQWGNYRLKIKQADLSAKKEVILRLLKVAYESYTGYKLEQNEAE